MNSHHLQVCGVLMNNIRHVFGLDMDPREPSITWNDLSVASKDWEYEEWLIMQLIFQQAYALSVVSFVWNSQNPVTWKEYEDHCAKHDTTPSNTTMHYYVINEAVMRNIAWKTSFDNNLVTVLKWYSSNEQVNLRRQCLVIHCLLELEVDMEKSEECGVLIVCPTFPDNVNDWIQSQRGYGLSKLRKNNVSE